MPNVYHGSLLRFVAEMAVAGFKSPRRHLRQWLGLAGIRDSKDAARHADRFWNFVRRGEREAAITYATEVADAASRGKDAQTLSWISGPLGGLEQYQLQARCLYESFRARGPVYKDWRGEQLGGTLLADFRHRTIAWPLRHSRFIIPASARARHCVVLCEPRLAPLFRRSFPGVEVQGNPDAAASAIRTAEAVTTHQDLLYFFSTGADAIAAAFTPLRPDPDLVAQFWRRYRSDNRPVIGISWGSSNQAKDAPAFADWAPILRDTSAKFVSLQYGSIGPALKKLRRLTENEIIDDASVDQMVDMDLFAAQVASLDAIVATSSTVVHLAGVLGVPSVVILDESLLHWPLFAAHTPWYPRTVLVHRHWREWPAVMKEARVLLDSVLQAAGTAPS